MEIDEIPLLRRIRPQAEVFGKDCIIEMHVSTHIQLRDEIDILAKGVKNPIKPLEFMLHIKHNYNLPHGEFVLKEITDDSQT